MFSITLLLALAAYVISLVVLRGALRRPRVGGNTARPFVSVIVAARNEAARLPELLADFTSQTYPSFEAIIVDDRSIDATSEIVRAAAARDARIKLLRQERVPVGDSPKKSALQAGIDSSGGELLLLTDADCRVQPTWIETIVRYFDEDVALVLGGSELSTHERSTLFERVQAFEFLTLVGLMAASANLRRPLGASGHNIAFRRTVFDAVGGYTSVMHRIAGDDMLMLQLVRARPELGRIVFADDLRSRNATHPESSWLRFRNQRARWASSGTHHFGGDKFFMFFAVGSLVVNMAALFGWAWAWAGWISSSVWLLVVLGKLAVDAWFFGDVCRRFERRSLLRYLPLWFLTQPVYLLLMAYWGQRNRFTWKP